MAVDGSTTTTTAAVASSDAGIPFGTVLFSWFVFAAAICAAAAFDLLCISRPRAADSLKDRKSPNFVRQIVFWLVAGLFFNGFIFLEMGNAAAGGWAYGYILEYMLSIDNLFVFQMIFKAYKTPPEQVDRALFWGISIAVVLRLAFFGIGTEILAMGAIPRIFFGLVLVYSGVKTLRDSDDEDSDPRDNPMVRCITALLPVHDAYGEQPTFFIRVDPSGDKVGPSVIGAAAAGGDVEIASLKDGRIDARETTPASNVEAPNLESETAGAGVDVRGGKLRVTLLFVVVATLSIIDIVFAVDSVTAKISSVSSFGTEANFFLNLTSSAYAMFVLRSLYFVVDMLTHMFRYLNYGVGLVLVFIGVKLILGIWVELGMAVSCFSILGVLGLSIFASAVIPQGDDDASPNEVAKGELDDEEAGPACMETSNLQDL